MEKYKKRELLEIVTILIEANEYISKKIDVNSDILFDMLSQCQGTALEIGNYIETYEKIGEPLVRILEEYCEDIYQLSLQLDEESLRRKLVNKIQRELLLLSNKIQDELPKDKKEIVFFPYKASMWDSLESVWKAAVEDGECEVYVVPIPYFDKNPDGSLGQMYYEGNNYPDYVSITSWEAYDIETRKPDAIFIHNPYDNWNHVTTIHPDFYASKLKDYTTQLIYIPYFILQEIEVDNDEAISRINHFCFLPGVIYANKVIVQSEKMRQIYINEYIKNARIHNLFIDKKELDNKIVALGSPKMDTMLKGKEEDFTIPQEWLKLIQSQDEDKKKVIFYNTSLAAFLGDSEQMIMKIKKVIGIFKEIKDEVILLWRPHPLMESTIKSMRPNLWDSYIKIVEQYKEEGWGIYDDSADIRRAIFISDAYYGDWSSIVTLYQVTGKPIMIQDAKLV